MLNRELKLATTTAPPSVPRWHICFWRARSDTRYSKLFTRNGDDHRIARQLFVAGLLLAGAGILLAIFCLVALLAMLLT